MALGAIHRNCDNMWRMCGRYTLHDTDRLRQRLRDMRLLEHSQPFIDRWQPRFNIAPTQSVLAVRASEERPGWEMAALRWGLLPHWSRERRLKYNTINAKAERVADAPAYRGPFRRRRALILADGMYEWAATSDGKQPYYIRLKSGEAFCFAGIWDQWRDPDSGEVIESCSIIVGPANDLVQPIHNRQAVILPPDAYERWLSPASDVDALKALLRPYPADDMEAWPVSQHVNRPSNDDAQCIAPQTGS